MKTRRVSLLCAVVVLVGGLAAGCGDDSSNGTTTGATTTGGTTTTPVTLEQPAIWPAADVTFTSPEAAAADFVSQVLEVPVNLGPFQAGDSRSGEIELRFAGEGSSGPTIVRSLLLLRQLGPDSGWFVLAAVNENASITDPESASTVPAGTLSVTGKARGFEGAVNVTAFTPGDPGTPLDRQLTQGGSMATPKRFTVDLDLSGAQSGQTVVLLVRGGVGLETDPGEVGAIPVTVE